MPAKREIDVRKIEETVRELCVKANLVLRPDVLASIKSAHDDEKDERSKEMLGILIENAEIAKRDALAICQDTGMVTVFMEIGQDVALMGGSLTEAVDSGVEKAYEEGSFRKSVVADPLERENTGTNTPAILHIDITKGDKVKISVMPKGFGAENKSRIGMLNPTQGKEAIIDFCIETVKKAGPDACPPFVLGIGLGGTLEECAKLAKKALLRPLGGANPKTHIAELEKEIKERVDALGIGVMGLGGKVTALGVNILERPTHIAGLPIAVNVCCHALRSATAEI